ncbi:STAS-like domain-containing protein [Candidatus Palauibacter sp.]|uniref:STAS-like domain-containing protein n=1 Tax=Candidatus Palauibacter sp. TaxID=3101350 RepID=UPI003B59340A
MKLAEEADSFGARRAGAPLRAKLRNIVKMSGGRRVVVDFSDVPLVSSSFADEVFGKLLVEVGPLQFMQTITLQGMSRIVSELVDRAMRQRSRTGL